MLKRQFLFDNSSDTEQIESQRKLLELINKDGWMVVKTEYICDVGNMRLFYLEKE